MRIIRAHIFGFGKWIDETFEFKDESFICFYGKNEAGKSTLQQFFLYMLFGLPPRKLTHFKPKYSSQIGGTLTVSFPELGKVTIERVEQQFRLLFANGEVSEDESILLTQLNDLQADTYRAIYGFSSLDLVELHRMKQTELSDLLFSVSLTGSTAIYDVERQLNRSLDELFKRTGRRPIINEQITKVTALEKQLIESKQETLSYREKINERNECADELHLITAQLEADEEQYIQKEKIVQFSPQILTLKRVTTELNHLRKQTLVFPENGVERYEQLKQQLVPITAESKNVNETIQEYRRLIVEKEQNLYTTEQYEQMTTLLAEQNANERNAQKRAELSQHIVELQTKITDYTSRLHITEADVEAFQAPFHAKTTWTELIEEGKRLQQENEHLEETKELVEQKHHNITEEKRRIEASFVGHEALQQIQADAHERSQNEKQQTSVKTLLEWETNRKKQSQQMLLVTGLIALVFFIVYFIQHNLSYVVFGAVLSILAFIQMYYVRNATNRITNLRDELQDIAKSIKVKENFYEVLHEQQQLASELTANEQLMKEVQIEQLQWEEKNNQFSLKEHKWIKAVEDERDKIPLLKQVELDYWLELLNHIEKINSLRSERERKVAEKDTIQEKLNEFQEALGTVGSRIAPEEDLFTIHHLQDSIKQHDSLEEQVNQYEQLKQSAKHRLTILEEEKNVLMEQINELFTFANVNNEEQYYQIARKVQEKDELTATYNELNNQLQSVFSDKGLTAIAQEEIDEFLIQREVDHLAAKIAEAKLAQKERQEQLTTLQVEIEQLESSDDYSHATHLYELERDKLNELAEQWATVKLAQTILQTAKLSYQEKYIADVMTYTTNYFSYLTLGNYTAVYPPTETESFQVEATNKMRYTVEELSKGTIDQLYVALRFAISKVMSEKFVVPLMIDDAFVHFDEERASLAVQLLEEIAIEQQVILYTCKRDVAQAVNEARSLRIHL